MGHVSTTGTPASVVVCYLGYKKCVYFMNGVLDRLMYSSESYDQLDVMKPNVIIQ